MRRIDLLLCLASVPLLGCGEGLESVSPVDLRATYAGPTPVVIESARATVTIRTAPFGWTVTDAAGHVLLDTLDTVPDVAGDDVHAYGPLGATHRDNVIRPPFLDIEGYDHVEPIDNPWHHGASVAALSATATGASIDLFDPADEATTIHVDVQIDGEDVHVRATSSNASLELFGQSFILPGDEHELGLGERFVSVDHRGRHYECWVEEGGIPQGEHAMPGPKNPGPNGPGMTGIPIPFYVSNKGYGLWIDTSFRTGFSFGAEDPRYQRIYSEGSALDYHLLVHDDPKATITHYTALTGRAQLPAKWAFGPRRRVDRGATVNGLPEDEALRAFGVPTTAADDATHFLPIGSEVGQAGAFAAWTAKLHSEGFKAIAYYNPYVSVKARPRPGASPKRGEPTIGS